MYSSPDSFPFGAPSEPTFEVALRGYEKRQVDRYVQQVEAEVAALTAERQELYAQINVLNHHVQQLQHEVANARRLASTPGDVSYRHLGARAEQILALAEEQAAEIRDRVTRELAEKEAALARTRAELDIRGKQFRTGPCRPAGRRGTGIGEASRGARGRGRDREVVRGAGARRRRRALHRGAAGVDPGR